MTQSLIPDIKLLVSGAGAAGASAPAPQNRRSFDATDWQASLRLQLTVRPLYVADLGWSREEAWVTRARLSSFEEDWDAPGMDIYDAR